MEKIAVELLSAQTEENIDLILNSEFFKLGKWKPLGGFEGNYGAVENQQAHPVASLVEKITNAIDAILLKECKIREIDPMGKTAPGSMKDAVSQFFGDDKEREKKRKELAGLIQIRADGRKDAPNIIIIDGGEGQCPEDFENTFLALLKSKTEKKHINFVQGRYYMGGSGVLPYCGQKGYELIISRSAIVKSRWGWTIIRKNREKEQYEYFVYENQIPSFEKEEFNKIKDGTIIKLFNYMLPHKSTITTELRNDLDLFLFDLHLPVLLKETRADLKPIFSEITLDGNRGKISTHTELLEPQYKMPIIIESDFGKYGKRKIELFVFKSDGELVDKPNLIRTKRRFTSDEMVVFFTINGQTHAALGRSFIKNRCKKGQLEKDLLVNIDFSGISGADRVDIFMPSRERMRKTEITKEIEENIEECIKEDETLKLLNENRFRKLVEKGRVDYEFVNQFVNRLIQKNPALIKYLKTGGKIANPQVLGDKIEDKFNPPFFPTIFSIRGWDEKKGIFTKEIPINSKGTNISFELNAPDDYFDRNEYAGTLNLEPIDMLVRRKLIRGILALRLKPTIGATQGAIHLITVIVTRYDDQPLILRFNVKYISPTPEKPSVPREKKVPEPPKLSDYGLPEHRLIRKDSWSEFNWTGEDIVLIQEMDGGKASDLKICINMDSDDLHDYLIRNRITSDKSMGMIENMYKIGVLLYSFVSFIELKAKYGNNETPIDEMVSIIMKGISKTMLDLHISEEMLKVLIGE
jgi:hypothetical protein